jgi:hypothetical protein
MATFPQQLPISVLSAPPEAAVADTVIDCATCVARATPHCTGCVVTYLCERGDGEQVHLRAEERASLELLQEAGMVPRLRHIPLLRVPA